MTRRSTVLEPRTLDSPISPIEPGQPDEEEVREKPGERQLSLALANSPILRFITRRDLFSFLNSAGVRECRVCESVMVGRARKLQCRLFVECGRVCVGVWNV